MATREDNFRVEVYDETGSTLLETLSRTPDLQISIAAWQMALRARPGMLLRHRNDTFVMDETVAPGEQKPGAPSTVIDGRAEKFDVALRDLRSWHTLRAYCVGCMHGRYLGVEPLKRKLGPETLFSEVEPKLVCTRCRGGPIRLEIHSAPRG